MVSSLDKWSVMGSSLESKFSIVGFVSIKKNWVIILLIRLEQPSAWEKEESKDKVGNLIEFHGKIGF